MSTDDTQQATSRAMALVTASWQAYVGTMEQRQRLELLAQAIHDEENPLDLVTGLLDVSTILVGLASVGLAKTPDELLQLVGRQLAEGGSDAAR